MPPERHEPSQGPIKVRQRNQKACDPCRKRKVKCDGVFPCATCVGYHYDCVYKDTPGRVPKISTNSMALPAILNHTPSDSGPAGPSIPSTWEHNNPKPYMAQETIVPGEGNTQLLHSIKTRFVSTYSAVAWPKRLGMSLGLPDPPRLQAFGWNPGTRSEQRHTLANNICNIISLEEMQRYSAIYFLVVHPFFKIVDEDHYKKRAGSYWLEGERGTDFEACMCGVVALGSYFSRSVALSRIATAPLAQESQIVEQGRLLLDLTTAYPPSMLSFNHVVSWVLRALYLRSTTRPHLSWMASCTAVHIAEAIGLHREISELNLPVLVKPVLRRNAFWVTMGINEYFAAEYGRSRVSLDSVGRDPMTEDTRSADLTADTVAILRCIPGHAAPGRINEVQVLEALTKALSLPAKSAFLALLKADACFCIYRMFCQCLVNSRLPSSIIPPLLEVIRVALDGSKYLKNMNEPWWNSVSTPFHSVCVLLSIGTGDSLAMLASTLENLKHMTLHYDSHLSREALRTAVILIQGARDKKSKELESLDMGLSFVSHVGLEESSKSTLPANDLMWQMGDDMELPDFLDLTNYYWGEP